ncbi:MAG TPA: hypothetical protein VID50_01335 [Candidatus Eisenbacteria bacterium]
MIPELFVVAFLGGLLALDRSAGVGVMLSQPLVGACLAGALLNPGPAWELWALRIPVGVGILLQLLLTDSALPGAQRPYDSSAAGVVGTAVALFAMRRLHGGLPIPTSGLLWVVLGTVAGLLAAVAGGPLIRRVWGHNRRDLPRLDRAAELGDTGAFEAIYWWGAIRILLYGAFWAALATAVLAGLALLLVPRLASGIHGGLVGASFAGLLGAGLAAAYFAHVRGRPSALRWAALGALAAVAAHVLRRGGAP